MQKKEERFPDVDEVISDQQINIRFAWKNKELDEGDLYAIDFYVTSEDIENYPVTRIESRNCVMGGKLGLTISTKGNILSVQDQYFERNLQEYGPNSYLGCPYEELYTNANWKLNPLLDDYCIYLDKYTIDDYKKDVDDIKPLDLFELIDMTTGVKLTYSLRVIYDEALAGN